MEGLREKVKKFGVDAKTQFKKDKNMLTKVIFARPLKLTRHFGHAATKTDDDKPFRMDASEEDFLFSVVTKHADFVLSNLEDHQVKTLIRAMDQYKASAGEKVIVQGDVGDYLYIVRKGTVRFLVDGNNEGTAGEGTVVGELALLYDCPRAATVVAETDCLFYRVSQETFRRLQASFVLSNDDETRRLLKQSDLFGNKNIPDHLIREIASCMFQKKFRKGDILVKKGEAVDEIYFVKSGIILGKDVSLGETKYADVRLHPGDSFGARAIVMNNPCPGTTECLTDGIVYVLTKERFFRCLDGLDFHALVDNYLESKILEMIPMIAYSDIDRIEIDQLVQKWQHITIEPGEALATVGDEVEPCLYFVTTASNESGHLEMYTKDGQVKHIGPTEGIGFGGETLVLSNIDGKKAALFGANHGLIKLGTEVEVLAAKHNLLKRNTVVAQSTVVAKGTKTIHLRKLTLKDLKEVIHDPLRLGRDYTKNRSHDVDVTKETLEKRKLLGQGTFGQVWLCKEPKKNLPYALKIQYKRELIDQHQADGVIRETRIMEKMHHPFVMGLVNAQQDIDCLYMMMSLVQGGELRQQMRNESKPHLSETAAKFYAACMLEGLSYMHRRDFIYRDLKGENVLLDKDGYCVIVDLGFAKFVPDKTFTFCGTPIFIAPEIILNTGHNKSADIWSLGVMIYEMLFGTNPFFDYDDPTIDQRTLFKRIVRAQFQRPVKQASLDAYSNTSNEAKDLIKRMLVVDPKRRLGCLKNADLDIRNHPWFSNPENGIDFGKLYRKEIPAPWVPEIKNPFDGSNFKAMMEDDKSGLRPLTAREQNLFKDFC